MREAPIVPGYRIQNEGRYQKRCKCGITIMMARMNETGGRWRSFEVQPIDGDFRQYREHWCAPTYSHSVAEVAPQQRRLL